MSKFKLALLGGDKLISSPFSPYNSIGDEESKIVNTVMQEGILSGFVGSWSDSFYGGRYVRKFEEDWCQYFDVQYSVSVNSNTSGLIAALGAIRLNPGDEVIVSTWSMCASATSILVWNAIPVFCDIESDTFNIDPKKIESLISSRTKAILVPDIFGHPAELDSIMELAKKHSLYVIEDCAQSPGAFYKKKKAGTIADIGVYSLNFHKHIHTGEGGVCVTNNPDLAERMQLIRNHGEAVVEGKKVDDISNIIGFNFRLTELQAAIGIEQLKKLNSAILYRQSAAAYLNNGLKGLEGLRLPSVMPECSHVYYTFPLIFDFNFIQVSRATLISALKAEGLSDIAGGYVNIHTYPMYQKRIAYGNDHFPWSMSPRSNEISYKKGICPTAENLHDNSFVNLLLCLSKFSSIDLKNIVDVFYKVWDNFSDLIEYESKNKKQKNLNSIA